MIKHTTRAIMMQTRWITEARHGADVSVELCVSVVRLLFIDPAKVDLVIDGADHHG